MKDTSHVFDSVMHICLVHLLSEQVDCHLYTLCNEWFVKNGILLPHSIITLPVEPMALRHGEMTLKSYGLLVSNLRRCCIAK